MYKVMVVDDEAWGRRSISKMISELALDVEVIAEAKHGEEALALIQINKPHIIVTDMNMPIMNGQQFLEHLYKHYSEIRVIVISGYSQFEYMKAAVIYQACEYVLKPISITELRNAMMKAIEASHQYLNLQQQKKFTQDIVKLKREVFLQHVTSQRITNLSDIHQHADELELTKATGDRYRLAVCMLRQFQQISSSKFHGNADLLMFSVENILYEVMEDKGLLVYKSDDRMRICILLPQPAYENKRILELVTAFHNAVNLILKADVLVGLSPIYDSLDQLSEAYHVATDELSLNSLQDSGLSLSSAEHSVTAFQSGVLSTFDLKSLSQAFASGNDKDSRKLLREMVNKVNNNSVIRIRDVHQEIRRILEMASSEIKGIVTAYPAVFDARLITGILDMGQFRSFMDQLIVAIDNSSSQRTVTESVHTIQEIALYLDGHYFEDVSLIDVATRFHMDPSYLSKLFKTVTDENFIEYITRKRMEKASELLRSSDRKINEISELVGYENQRYFSQVFKKVTSQTPTEYREQHVEKIENQK